MRLVPQKLQTDQAPSKQVVTSLHSVPAKGNTFQNAPTLNRSSSQRRLDKTLFRISNAAGSSAETSTSARQSAANSSSNTVLTYTSHEGNSWAISLKNSGVSILVDPWLVDSLTFGGLDFIYEGKKKVAKPGVIDIEKIVNETDLILLTMSIDDHAHKPTLKRLPKTIPIVGSPSACRIARELGFMTVVEVDYQSNKACMCDGKISIQATEGALVGPPWSKREVGFVIREKDGISLYYEPHCDYVASSVAAVGQVDVVVSPPSTQSLLGYDLVKGNTDNIALLKMLRPRVLIPLMNAEFEATGPLDALLTEKGGTKELEAALKKDPELKDIKICLPEAGQPMSVRF